MYNIKIEWEDGHMEYYRIGTFKQALEEAMSYKDDDDIVYMEIWCE